MKPVRSARHARAQIVDWASAAGFTRQADETLHGRLIMTFSRPFVVLKVICDQSGSIFAAFLTGGIGPDPRVLTITGPDDRGRAVKLMAFFREVIMSGQCPAPVDTCEEHGPVNPYLTRPGWPRRESIRMGIQAYHKLVHDGATTTEAVVGAIMIAGRNLDDATLGAVTRAILTERERHPHI